VQVDIDPHACDLARENAERNRLAARVEVRCGDLSDTLRPEERFAAVLADPPYLPSSEVGAWPDDPRLAIDGGDDGLELLRRCIEVARRHLSHGGVVLMQTAGRRQLEALAPEIATAGLRCVEVREVDEYRAVGLLCAAELR
jgi:release factor glutamine methyltransferase